MPHPVLLDQTKLVLGSLQEVESEIQVSKSEESEKRERRGESERTIVI